MTSDLFKILIENPGLKLNFFAGLRENQIPSYIYRMRELGYPPGWLKEAEVEHSNFALFLEPGTTLPDVDDEDGEIADAQEKLKYDFSKIQTWPGFNVEIDPKYKDESQYYR